MQKRNGLHPTSKRLQFTLDSCLAQTLLLFSCHLLAVFFVCVCVCVCLCVPAGHPAGTHTAAASGAVGPFGAAKCSRGAADGAEPRAPRPGCSGPATRLKC